MISLECPPQECCLDSSASRRKFSRVCSTGTHCLPAGEDAQDRLRSCPGEGVLGYWLWFCNSSGPWPGTLEIKDQTPAPRQRSRKVGSLIATLCPWTVQAPAQHQQMNILQSRLTLNRPLFPLDSSFEISISCTHSASWIIILVPLRKG